LKGRIDNTAGDGIRFYLIKVGTRDFDVVWDAGKRTVASVAGVQHGCNECHRPKNLNDCWSVYLNYFVQWFDGVAKELTEIIFESHCRRIFICNLRKREIPSTSVR
jgi:hypothetical protein